MTTAMWKKELHYHAPYPAIALAGFAFAGIAAAAAVLSGVGSRLGWWYFGKGIMILLAAAAVGLISVVADTVSAIVIRGPKARHVFLTALAGVIMGLLATGIPAYWIGTAAGTPGIHDITTDTNDPPSFVAILPLRQDAADPATYGGPAVAALQRSAYPDIRPLILPLSPRQVYPRALEEAHNMGWAVVAADPAHGRIEATATTFWFGFKDDVVVRIRPDGSGSRVDVRSVSRVGRGDLGTNARRIRKYLHALAAEA